MTETLILHAAEETLEAVHTRRHAAYPVYKPSGIEWLGDVPEHWETLSLKHIASVQFSNVDKHTVEGEVPVRLCNYTDVYYTDSITEDLQFMEATATEHEVSRFKLERGDVLITKDSEDWSDIAVPALVTDEFADVLCGYHLAQIRPQSTHCTGAYLARAFASSGIMNQFHVAATGVTRYGLPKNALRKAIFPVPPLEEQQAIARFLDEQTRKIDDLIEAKRSLLDLLKEKRQAVITHAVTRGLDPAAKLKPSGVEWLGDVPEHWDVKPLRYLGKAIIGLTYSPEGVVSEGEGTLVLRAGNIQNGQIRDANNVYVDMDVPDHLIMRSKDILICSRSGSRGLIGKNALISKNEAGSTFGAFMTVFRSPYNDFLYWVLNSRLFAFYSGAFMTTTINQLTLGTLKTFLTPAPPLKEQQAIARFLEEETKKMDDLESVVREAIETLESLRAGIISAAVTGKIDVREEGV